MPTQQEAKQDSKELLTEYVTVLWRRKFWFIIPVIGGVVLAAALILYLPKSYKSTTLILVEEQQIPEEFVRSTVSEPVAGRLATIRQQIMSRSFLERIVEKFGLFKKSGKMLMEEKVELMRKAVEIKTMGEARLNAFSITFVGDSPMTTMNVTNELASLLIKENLKIREQMVEGTTEFIDGELENLKRTLERQEGAISQFKQNYSGELPGQMDASLRTLDRLQIGLQQTKLALKEAEGADPLLQGWTIQTQKLATLQRRYKDNHPDILALKKEIRELEERMIARGDGLPSSKSVSVKDEKSSSLLPPKLKIDPNTAEIAELKLSEKRIEGQILDFENRIDNVPKREQELAILLRDYDNTQKNYQTLLDKKLTAKISENLEKRQKGEQFRILDAANFPGKPYTPDPVKMSILGCFLGIVSGFGLVLIREMADSSVRQPEDLEKLSSLPVLASILDYKDFQKRVQKRPKRKGEFNAPGYMEDPHARKRSTYTG